jgi:hypothetical protein
VIGASGDQKSNTEARLTADEGGLGPGKGLPLIHTENTDLEGMGKILPQPVGGEVYANRGQTSEVHANLG